MFFPVLHFIGGILSLYFLEQFAYARITSAAARREKKISQEYGWRIIWDLIYYLSLIGAGYRVIFLAYWNWFGYFVFIAGILLRIWALKELAQFYDPGIAFQPDHQIVQTGPFRVLRHPLHLGTLLKIGGLTFFLPTWLALPTISASTLLALYLNYTEDRIHLERLGGVFRDYYLKTWDMVDLIFWKK